MSVANLSQEAMDASNRVLGLLAGATAQSFKQIGYGFVEPSDALVVNTAGEAFNFDSGNTSGSDASWDSSSSSAFHALLKTLQDTDSTVGALGQVVENDSSMLPESGGVVDLDATQAEMDGQLAWAGSSQNVSSPDEPVAGLGSQLDSTNGVESAGSFVSDLLFDLLAQLTNDESYESELNGEKQAAFRDLLDSVGLDVESITRDFFQSNVQGQVKEVTGELIDTVGIDALNPVIDPIHDYDYYGTSADLIQDTRDALSLSSIALPQIGPMIAWVRDDLLQRADA